MALLAAWPWTPACQPRGCKFLPSKSLVRGTSRLQPQNATAAHAAGARGRGGGVSSGGSRPLAGCDRWWWGWHCLVRSRTSTRGPRAFDSFTQPPLGVQETWRSGSRHLALLHRDRGSRALNRGGAASVLGSPVMGVPLPRAPQGFSTPEMCANSPRQEPSKQHNFPCKKRKKRTENETEARARSLALGFKETVTSEWRGRLSSAWDPVVTETQLALFQAGKGWLREQALQRTEGRGLQEA